MELRTFPAGEGGEGGLGSEEPVIGNLRRGVRAMRFSICD